MFKTLVRHLHAYFASHVRLAAVQACQRCKTQQGSRQASTAVPLCFDTPLPNALCYFDVANVLRRCSGRTNAPRMYMTYSVSASSSTLNALARGQTAPLQLQPLLLSGENKHTLERERKRKGYGEKTKGRSTSIRRWRDRARIDPWSRVACQSLRGQFSRLRPSRLRTEMPTAVCSTTFTRSWWGCSTKCLGGSRWGGCFFFVFPFGRAVLIDVALVRPRKAGTPGTCRLLLFRSKVVPQFRPPSLQEIGPVLKR